MLLHERGVSNRFLQFQVQHWFYNGGVLLGFDYPSIPFFSPPCFPPSAYSILRPSVPPCLTASLPIFLTGVFSVAEPIAELNLSTRVEASNCADLPSHWCCIKTVMTGCWRCFYNRGYIAEAYLQPVSTPLVLCYIKQIESLNNIAKNWQF